MPKLKEQNNHPSVNYSILYHYMQVALPAHVCINKY